MLYRSYKETVKVQRVKGRIVEPQFHSREREFFLSFSFHASIRHFSLRSLRYRELRRYCRTIRVLRCTTQLFALRLQYNTTRVCTNRRD